MTYGIPGWGEAAGAAGAVAAAATEAEEEKAGGVCYGARREAFGILVHLTETLGFHAALSGAGALRLPAVRRMLLGTLGLDCVLRVRELG